MIDEKVLRGLNKLYFDTPTIIYYTEKHPIYSDAVEFLFEYLVSHKLVAITSIITLSECLTKPIKSRDVLLIANYEQFLGQSKEIELLDVNRAISRLSANLRALYGLRTPDALHIATALESKCEAFITNDIGLKRVTQLKIIVLDELII